MLTLYSYPTLFGVADNNGYGLKVFAFLKLAGVPFAHEHIFDASKAPRGQLPYIVDGSDTVGDSETILGYVSQKYHLTIDAALTPAQRIQNLLITRMLDDLYWVMSYSRWKDDRFFPLFREALLRTHSDISPEALERAETHRAFWRPPEVRVVLLAESHVFTGAADLERRIVRLPGAAVGIPPGFVRLVYLFTRRKLGRVVLPVKIMAYHPRLLRALVEMEQGQLAAKIG